MIDPTSPEPFQRSDREAVAAESAASGGASGTPSDLAALQARFAGQVLAAEEGGRDEPTALVAREAIGEIARWLRDERGFQLLRSVTAVDFLSAAPRFQVVYHLSALPAHVLAGDPGARAEEPTRRLRLKVALAAEDAVLPSIRAIYPTADWHEREVFDLFGIEFAGHPDLRRILLPADFEGFPLRKDHPLVYEEVAFSFNQDEIYRRKPFATE